MYCTQFQIEFPLFWTFNLSANLDWPYINNVHNFPLNFRCSGYSIFLQIPTFRTYDVQNSLLNFRGTGHSIFRQIQPFLTYITYRISRWIFGVLVIQFPLQIQTFRTYTMYTISRRIFAVWIVNFLQIQTFRTYNAHNFQLNLRNYGNQFFFKSKHSVRIMYWIFCRIYGVLDIQFFCKSRHYVHITYTISSSISAVLDIQFFSKSRRSMRI